MSQKAELIHSVKTLPQDPGVYQFYDKNGKILYVGKAKNLKKRVSSYFQKEHDHAKTRILVSKINSLETIVVETEYDALLLENNLIKKKQPRYNILLKDDKSFPWICIKKEPFPRIFLTRKLIKDGSEYFGPYANVKVAYTLLDLIRELYPIRNCNLDLSLSNIVKGKMKVCLEYHIGNCLGPCEGFQTKTDYDEQTLAIKEIIKGSFSKANSYLKNQMADYSEHMEYEKAQIIKDKLDLLKNYQAKSTIVHPSITNVDVFSILSDETDAYINFLRMANGAIIQSHTLEIKKRLEESDQELLAMGILELRERFSTIHKEIFLPFSIEASFPDLKMTVPKIGDKKRIVDLSLRNAKYYRLENIKQMKIADPERHSKRILAQMKKDLRLPQEPKHIEGFDNSNIQGTNPASACVVFKDAKPSKRDYRKFNIKTVDGPNDFASMEEVVQRRYSRLLAEGQELPQLILIDGGKGQLSAAMKSLDRLGLRGKISILGIAKRLEELYFPDDSLPLYLDKKSETLKVLQQIRDEAHRFGLNHHRNKRSKEHLKSELDLISGVGARTKAQLLTHFKSLKRTKEASEEELAKVVGKSRAFKIKAYFNQNEKDS